MQGYDDDQGSWVDARLYDHLERRSELQHKMEKYLRWLPRQRRAEPAGSAALARTSPANMDDQKEVISPRPKSFIAGEVPPIGGIGLYPTLRTVGLGPSSLRITAPGRDGDPPYYLNPHKSCGAGLFGCAEHRHSWDHGSTTTPGSPAMN